jgi:hypothetical protein
MLISGSTRAMVAPARPRRRQTGFRAPADQLSFVFRERAEDVKEQFTVRRAGVDILREADERHAALFGSVLKKLKSLDNHFENHSNRNEIL